MTAARDTFAAFVDSLAARLDDHEATGSDLAARAFLSRFHFDRLVVAAAGETPAQLRRRVLLERAAYRLVTSDRSILDIGVEAGYSSHEAFTRAFSRAYLRTPSAWRAGPRQIQLDCPNGVHFHPPGSLRLPSTQKVSSMDLVLRMIEHHIWLVGEMVDRAERLDDDHLDAPLASPTEDGLTVRSVLSRLIGQLGMWNSAVGMRDYDWSVEEHETVAGMRRRLAVEGPAFLQQVRDVIGTDRLGDTFVDALQEPPEVFTYGGMIAHVLTFAAYRRTLVVGALDAAGIPDLGWGDPMLWVASGTD
jgi:AraC family transcriptional regulator